MQTPGSRPIPVDQILEPRAADRARILPEEIQELALSIKEQGLINPILLRPEGSLYEIIAGNRRFLAHKWLGRSTIEATVRDADPGQAAELRLTENIQRSDLTPLEEALAVRRLTASHGLSVAECAARCAKSEAWVRLRLQLLTWPEDIIARISSEQLPLGVAGHLAAIGDPLERARLTHIAIESGANARTVMSWRSAWEAGTTTTDFAPVPVDPALAAAQAGPPLFPCWACNHPTDLLRLQVVRFCPQCLITLAAARNATTPSLD